MMAPSQRSESDDERTLQASDEDVLREEEDTERLLESPKSTITSLFNGAHDPNQPRDMNLTRKEAKRQKRRERRARIRQGKRKDEASLMFEMEEGARRSSEDSSSISSEEMFSGKKKKPWKAVRNKHFPQSTQCLTYYRRGEGKCSIMQSSPPPLSRCFVY